MDVQIEKNARDWAMNPCFDEKTRQEVQQLLDRRENDEITDRFYRDLEFGTGGLRGILGAGTSRMNTYNIQKATTAFAIYLKKTYPHRQLKIGITYDSRRMSREFAETTASTFAAHGIAALMTEELRPVPMLSYMVRAFGCDGGVCLTASHNPPNYNGYKVYWKTGGQVVPPHDQSIIKEYASLKDYAALPKMSFAEGIRQGLIELIGSKLDDAYFEKLQTLRLQSKDWGDFRIAFTPLHGTAGKPVKRALQEFGFKNIDIVPEQEAPNGEFPTVKFPNPEEPDALRMAVDLARAKKADLVLGTDPDCDRVGIVYRKAEEYRFLNGNQIGCLLTEYVLSQMKAQGKLPPLPLVVKTIVTTELQAKIGEYHGCHVDDTLTGFKWICGLVEEYDQGIRQPQRNFVCGGEESYGFLAGNFVRDKDGIAACVIAAEMTAYYKSKGQTLDQVLDSLYRRHGVFHERLSTLTLPGKKGADQIKRMMAMLRSEPPLELCGSRVIRIDDIEQSRRWNPTDPSRYESIDLPRSDVLQFFLEDGSKVSVRPSGTEPKIKFYISACKDIAPDCSQEHLVKTKNECEMRSASLEKAFTILAEAPST